MNVFNEVTVTTSNVLSSVAHYSKKVGYITIFFRNILYSHNAIKLQ
jgi:hypothetical protein